ncbi:CheY-like chemotaxis protein [Deinococcus metalli]|uniref:CheY-like chemotaxis protein n=1 Tax=Deinococcus metalli TaxID=1141878 RepID=A0A7W8NN24_9DEIO|nr:response regulator [Deinococcus metalli]MBB5376429.1 CheY-like chemotaxis protein [Deinococcus metalli]GHF44112.1 hypothetical protein GCM10017781_20740 [Deinococcus metalli]
MADRLRVMVIDDNEHALELARLAFEEHGDAVNVTTFDSGESALDALHDRRRPRPHVIVLDINMPGTSGFDVLAQL